MPCSKTGLELDRGTPVLPEVAGTAPSKQNSESPMAWASGGAGAGPALVTLRFGELAERRGRK